MRRLEFGVFLLSVSLCVLFLVGALIVAIRFAFGEKPADSAADSPAAAQVLFGLAPGPGREHVIANCLPCHSTAIIAANHLTRDGWDGVIAQMQDKNGMRPLEASVRTAILDYLERAQRPDDAGLTAGRQSPWATPLYRPNPLW